MKKFLALMFVCAGLTAMAAPHVNKADFTTKPSKGEMVMKANTLSNQLTAGVNENFMVASKEYVQKTSGAANLVNKRAPRRMTAQDIIAKDYVTFLYAYTYDENGELVPDDPHYTGFGAYWYPDASDGLYFVGLCVPAFGSYWYLPIDVDFETGEVALSWGILLEDDTLTGAASGRTRVDTIQWSALMSEAYWNNNEQTDCKGTLYNDGSIIFDDNYVYYGYQILNTYRQNTLVSSDTTDYLTVYKGTEILAANGMLSFTKENGGEAGQEPVFMFQNASSDTLYVGNMYGHGMPNVVLTIDNDAKMHYNCTIEEDSQTYLYNPIWNIGSAAGQGGLDSFYGIGALIETEDGVDVEWGFSGDVTPDQITWDYASMCNGYHITYGFQNNVLTWNNGNKFSIPGGVVAMRGDIDNDGTIGISDVTILIDHLLNGDLDDSDNFSSDAADTDLDGEIGISDVTALIDYLLSNEW